MQNPARRPHACSILLVFERERYCDLTVIFVTRPELVRSNLKCLHFHVQKKTSSEAVRVVGFYPQAWKKYCSCNSLQFWHLPVTLLYLFFISWTIIGAKRRKNLLFSHTNFFRGRGVWGRWGDVSPSPWIRHWRSAVKLVEVHDLGLGLGLNPNPNPLKQTPCLPVSAWNVHTGAYPEFTMLIYFACCLLCQQMRPACFKA